MNDLRDPFNPKTGEFAENIRAITRSDDSELRASLKQFGWRKEFPAYKDERGVVLVGHRRLKIAKALGIKPVLVELSIGQGDEADAERLKIALASNIGFAPMLKEDRERIAKYLYSEREWTMQRIGKALNVGFSTIQRDLGDLPTVGKSKDTKTATNPKGAGRPKGSKQRVPRQRKTSQVVEDTAASLVLDQGMTHEQAAAQTGLTSVQQVKTSVAREEGRREVRATPEIDPKTLSLTAQEKLEAAIRQHKRKLDLEFEQRVLAECKSRMDSISLPHYAKQLEELEHSISNRKGFMDRLTYRKILACLHPDRAPDPALKKRFEEAFRLFTELEKCVLDEKESPTTFRKMPRTYEELMAMRAKVQADRRAKRGGTVSVR